MKSEVKPNNKAFIFSSVSPYSNNIFNNCTFSEIDSRGNRPIINVEHSNIE